MIRRDVPPGGEIKEFNLRVAGMERNIRDTGVFDFEHVRSRQGKFQQDGENHANDPAMAKDADRLAGVVLNDFAYAGFDTAAELGAALAIGKNSLFDVLQ